MIAVASTEDIGVYSTDEGLHLANSVLWLDSWGGTGLSFLSFSEPTHRRRLPGRFIASADSIKLLGIRKKDQILACQYNQGFSLGKLTIEMLPSGSFFGSASLHIQQQDGDILYAPNLLTDTLPITRRMELKGACKLILPARFPLLLAGGYSRKKEKLAILAATKKSLSNGKAPIFFCEHRLIGTELTYLFQQEGIPVWVDGSIRKSNRFYKAAGAPIAGYSVEAGVHIYSERKLSHPATDHQSHFMVRATPSESYPLAANQISSFFLPLSSYERNFKNILEQVNPRVVGFFGQFAQQYAVKFRKHGVVTQPIHPFNQQVLF